MTLVQTMHKHTALGNKYANLTALYENYKQAHDILFFENTPYLLQGFVQDGERYKHYYRCEQEMHNLVIHLIGGSTYLVEGIYSVKPLELRKGQ